MHVQFLRSFPYLQCSAFTIWTFQSLVILMRAFAYSFLMRIWIHHIKLWELTFYSSRRFSLALLVHFLYLHFAFVQSIWTFKISIYCLTKRYVPNGNTTMNRISLSWSKGNIDRKQCKLGKDTIAKIIANTIHLYTKVKYCHLKLVTCISKGAYGNVTHANLFVPLDST